MFSTDLGNVDLRIVLAVVVVAFVLKIADTVTSRLLWRDGTIKDMQILSALKDLGEDALYSEYRKLVRKRILDKVHGYNAAALTQLASSKRHDVIGVTLIVISFAVGFALAGSSAGGLVLLGGVWNWVLVASMVEGAVLVVFAAATTVVMVAAAKRGKREKEPV